MILGVYSFLDTQVGLFSQPFYAAHPALAKRLASELVGDPSTTISRHPSCFALYSLGEFDDNTGRFSQGEPVMVCMCSSLVAQELPKVEYVDV